MGGFLAGHQNCVCTFDDWLEDLPFIGCVRPGQLSYAVSPEMPSKDDFCLLSSFAGWSVTLCHLGVLHEWGNRKDRFDYVKQLVRTRPVHIDIPVVTVRSDFVAVELPSARLLDCRFDLLSSVTSGLRSVDP